MNVDAPAFYPNVQSQVQQEQTTGSRPTSGRGRRGPSRRGRGTNTPDLTNNEPISQEGVTAEQPKSRSSSRRGRGRGYAKPSSAESVVEQTQIQSRPTTAPQNESRPTTAPAPREGIVRPKSSRGRSGRGRAVITPAEHSVLVPVSIEEHQDSLNSGFEKPQKKSKPRRRSKPQTPEPITTSNAGTNTEQIIETDDNAAPKRPKKKFVDAGSSGAFSAKQIQHEQ
jgi:hypothetical protein